MSEISNQRRLEILGSLKSTKCAACGQPKKAMRSHCQRCYFALTPELRRGLYQRFGSGYEEAYEESLRFLSEKYPPAAVSEAGAVSS